LAANARPKRNWPGSVNRAKVREGFCRNLRGPEFDQLRMLMVPGMEWGLAIAEAFAAME
jgi:hypothetical protein